MQKGPTNCHNNVDQRLVKPIYQPSRLYGFSRCFGETHQPTYFLFSVRSSSLPDIHNVAVQHNYDTIFECETMQNYDNTLMFKCVSFIVFAKMQTLLSRGMKLCSWLYQLTCSFHSFHCSVVHPLSLRLTFSLQHIYF